MKIKIFSASDFLRGEIGNRHDVIDQSLNTYGILKNLEKTLKKNKKKWNLTNTDLYNLFSDITGLNSKNVKNLLNGKYKLPEDTINNVNVVFIPKEYGDIYGYKKERK